MTNRKKYIIPLIIAILSVAILFFGYYYITAPNIRFINTDKNNEVVGPTYVRVKVDGNTNALISQNSSTGSNIITDIKQVQSKVEDTASIDTMLKKELDGGNYTLHSPLIVQNPYKNSPLTAVALFKTEAECNIRVTVKGKTEENDISSLIEEKTKSHIVPILGLYPSYENKVIIELADDNNEISDSMELSIKTESLPESLNNAVELDNNENQAEAYAIDMMMITGLDTPYVYAFDSAGDIRWYINQSYEYYGAYPLSNGRFLLESETVMTPTSSMPHSSLFYEMDYLGRVYQEYFIPDGVHHDIQEMSPNGNFLVLTNSGGGYEQDAVMEIERTSGKVIKKLDLKEIFNGLSYIDGDDWAH